MPNIFRSIWNSTDGLTKWIQVVALCVAAAWTFRNYSVADKPSLEPNIAVTSEFFKGSSWQPDTCLVKYSLTVRNEGKVSFDVDKIHFQTWYADAPQTKSPGGPQKPLFVDVENFSSGSVNLGNGTEKGSAVPVPVSGELRFRSVSVGGPTCGLTAEGKLYCWGSSYENVNGVMIYRMEYGTVPMLVPDDAYMVSVRLINTLRLERNFEKAWAEADAALKQYPKERAIKRVHALMLGDLRKTSQALAEMRELLGGEKDRETHLDMANIYKRAKNYNEMEKSLQLAEQLSHTKEDPLSGPMHTLFTCISTKKPKRSITRF